MARTAAGMQTGAMAQGQSVDWSVEGVAKEHLLGKVVNKRTIRRGEFLCILHDVLQSCLCYNNCEVYWGANFAHTHLLPAREPPLSSWRSAITGATR